MRRKAEACPRHGPEFFTSHEVRCPECGGFGLCLDCLRANGHGLNAPPPPEKPGPVHCALCRAGRSTRERHRENRQGVRRAEEFS